MVNKFVSWTRGQSGTAWRTGRNLEGVATDAQFGMLSRDVAGSTGHGADPRGVPATVLSMTRKDQ